jgi:hypothetical protein
MKLNEGHDILFFLQCQLLPALVCRFVKVNDGESKRPIEALKIPYSLWVCGFDSRPRHLFTYLMDFLISADRHFVPNLSPLFLKYTQKT